MTSDKTRTTGVSIESESAESVGDDQRIDVEKARQGVRLLLESMGQDPNEPPLYETWQRRVPQALEELSEGFHEADKPDMRTFESDTSDLVVKTGIPLHSLCEHHFLPYTGTAHVAYRPDGEVVGLSKLTRYVRWRFRRLTIQEGLTTDIAEGLAREVGAEAVLVEIEATHLCEAMRGIETATETRTTATVGDPTGTERQRFWDAISRTE